MVHVVTVVVRNEAADYRVLSWTAMTAILDCGVNIDCINSWQVSEYDCDYGGLTKAPCGWVMMTLAGSQVKSIFISSPRSLTVSALSILCCHWSLTQPCGQWTHPAIKTLSTAASAIVLSLLTSLCVTYSSTQTDTPSHPNTVHGCVDHFSISAYKSVRYTRLHRVMRRCLQTLLQKQRRCSWIYNVTEP
jgi:hypothetical protein